MAFNYSSLQKITTDGLVDGTIVGGDISNGTLVNSNFATDSVSNAKLADATVVTANIADGNITSSNMGSSSVNLASSVVVNTLPTSLGGTGLSFTGGNANKSLRGNSAGTALQYDDSGLVSVAVYTSSTTWSRPAGVTRVRVQLVGGGGGGTGHGEAGGAGGYSERYLDVTGISSVSVTVGGGGGGVTYHNVGGNGAATSFGPYLSASAGEGARAVGGHTGGRPGIGSGGNVNIYGGGGSGHTYHGGGLGGFSYFGGSSIGAHAESPATAAYESWASPGAGGTGGAQARHRGASGKGGIVLVWHYK